MARFGTNFGVQVVSEDDKDNVTIKGTDGRVRQVLRSAVTDDDGNPLPPFDEKAHAEKAKAKAEAAKKAEAEEKAKQAEADKAKQAEAKR